MNFFLALLRSFEVVDGFALRKASVRVYRPKLFKSILILRRIRITAIAKICFALDKKFLRKKCILEFYKCTFSETQKSCAANDSPKA